MPEERQRERDLILSPNEYAFISDQTKGNINVYVGPYKASLSNTDQPIIFNEHTKRFEKCILETSIQTFAIAPEGWYLILKNPQRDMVHPKTGTVNNMGELNVGHKVNIPGPVSFPLWPGQMVGVVKGHHLRSNQYLVVRVYDEIAARENWNKAVIKTQVADGDTPSFDINQLALGKMYIIKGTNVSFYIPPTGIEVVKDQVGNYRREAVTLERLEYCILLDENGNKRYVRGPEVVFPEPTEVLIEKDGLRKFKAIELSEIKGIYLKVIAPYTEGDPGSPQFKEYKEGDELFITGKDMMIYFPRKEHAIVKYDGNEIHYAVAIPAGTSRYVMNRLTGEVTLRKGPDMFLPDPRTEVIVRRILDPRQVELWFPGNQKAKEINEELKKHAEAQTGLPPSAAPGVKGKQSEQSIADLPSPAYSGDSFERMNKFSPPRTITLDTKYEGAVTIDIWTGYAIMVVGKFKERKVVVGPASYILEFDEYLEVFSLSTSNPKSDTKLIKDVYLRVLNNQVSDTIEVESKDFVNVQIKLSYRLNFTGDSSTWFNVENYVKFLTDRFRSIFRSTVKQFAIEDFYTNAYSIIKKTVLGEDMQSGYTFKENNMHVYDIEILNVKILDESIAKLMMESQQATIQQHTTINREKAKLEITKSLEEIKRDSASAQFETKSLIYTLEKEETNKKKEVEITKIASENQAKELRLEHDRKAEEFLALISKLKLEREKAESEQERFFIEKDSEIYLRELMGEAAAIAEKTKAITPDFIAALQAFADKHLLEKVSETMSPLAILGGESVADVFARLLEGTKLESVFLNMGSDALSILPQKKLKDNRAKGTGE
jgi:major vault protein